MTNQISQDEINAILWKACDTFRGTVDPSEYKLHIDYVVMHELCHFKEHHHGRRFYELLDRVMPDWQTRQKRLNSLGIN